MHFTRIFPFGSGRSPPAPNPSHLLVRALFWEAPPPPPPSWFSEPAPPPPCWRQPTPHTITSIVAVCVCEEPRHLITRRVRGKESGSRFAICLPGTCLSHPAALPPSFHAHRSHTHATHTIITSTQQYGKRSSLSHLIRNFTNI